MQLIEIHSDGRQVTLILTEEEVNAIANVLEMSTNAEPSRLLAEQFRALHITMKANSIHAR
jgi:hypothetical protein